MRKQPLEAELAIDIHEFAEGNIRVALQNFKEAPKTEADKDYLLKEVPEIMSMEAVVLVTLDEFAAIEHTKEAVMELKEELVWNQRQEKFLIYLFQQKADEEFHN